MKQFHHIDTMHSDLVHDVAYDYYGKRLATCSSDMRIQVWDLVAGETDVGESKEQWCKTAEWHGTSVFATLSCINISFSLSLCMSVWV